MSEPTQFQLNLAQSTDPWVKGIQICSTKGPRPFPKGEIITKLRKYIDEILNFFYSRTPRPISTKLNTKHPCVMKTQVCSNEGPRLFLRGDHYEIPKCIEENLKIFFPTTTDPILTKLYSKHSWVKGIQVCSNKGHAPFQAEIIIKLRKYIDEIKKIFFSRSSGPISNKLGKKSP